jgi:hypothetical protein
MSKYYKMHSTHSVTLQQYTLLFLCFRTVHYDVIMQYKPIKMHTFKINILIQFFNF